MAVNQWNRIESRSVERLKLLAQLSTVAVGTDVVVRSPVDESRFRNNWFSGLNNVNTKTTTRTSRKGFGEKGGVRLAELSNLASSIKLGDEIFFTNSLPYARRLEFGWSQLAPMGMVRIATAQWPLVVARVTRQIK